MSKRRRETPVRHPKPSLADALFGQTKQRVLGLLFGQPDRDFGTVEIIDLIGAGRGAVQRELEALSGAGVIESRIVGLQKRYFANPQSPVFAELRGIVEKTSGIAGILRDALMPIADKIEVAVLYGSVPKRSATAQSDVDLLVVSSELTLEEAYRSLEPAEARIGRRINPTLYTPAEFRSRRQTKQPFVTKVLSGPHAIFMGALDGAHRGQPLATGLRSRGDGSTTGW